MQRFRDRAGIEWEVVAGRESWGAIVALFIPVVTGPGIRQAPLPAAGYGEATTLLESLSNEALQELLDRSGPKTS
ncbi:MAG: hypothetical protein P8188_06600 [Gemmatimonadota bacterium]